MAMSNSIVLSSQKSLVSSDMESIDGPSDLHSSDNSPNSLLVSIQLMGDNYKEWCAAMMMALCAKNKVGFVDGTIKKPSPDDPVAFSAWNQEDQMVLSWLVNSLHEDFVLRNVNANSAAELWKDLSYRFSPDEGLRIFNLQKALATLKQGNDNVTVYYEKLKDIWYYSTLYLSSTPCTCESTENYFRIQNLMQFLIGLNESYDTLRRKILSMDPLPLIDDAYSLVLKEEIRRGLSVLTVPSEHRNSYAALVKSTQSYISTHSLISPDKSNLHLHCGYCKVNTHTIDKCYKLHGYPQTLEDLFTPNDRAMELQHFSHEHPLTFSKKSNRKICCSGCRLLLSGGPTYSCNECSFVLHYLCAKVPQKMHDVAHKIHPLTLLLDTPNCNGNFVCCACGGVGKGFHYNCATCQFSIDVHCALIPESLKHHSHSHPLSLKPSTSSSQCAACGEPNEGVSFGCLDCKKKRSFEIHVYCVTLPISIKHKGHEHSLSLRSSYELNEEQKSVSCAICSKRINQKFWYYGCNTCNKVVAHTECAASMVLYGAQNVVEKMQIPNRVQLMKRNILAGRIEECGQWYP